MHGMSPSIIGPSLFQNNTLVFQFVFEGASDPCRFAPTGPRPDDASNARHELETPMAGYLTTHVLDTARGVPAQDFGRDFAYGPEPHQTARRIRQQSVLKLD